MVGLRTQVPGSSKRTLSLSLELEASEIMSTSWPPRSRSARRMNIVIVRTPPANDMSCVTIAIRTKSTSSPPRGLLRLLDQEIPYSQRIHLGAREDRDCLVG